MRKFGDIFRYKEDEYVFLAQSDGIIYAAQILDKEKTNQILRLYEKRKHKSSNVLYSYVILSTDDFKDRMAHLNNTDKNNVELSLDIIGSLNKQDLNEIKAEILNTNSAVSMKLKQLIKDIEIN